MAENIIDVVSEHTKLEKRGVFHVGICPFHKEKTASFVVSEKGQQFHCFGCGRKGDLEDFKKTVATFVLDKLIPEECIPKSKEQNDGRRAKR